MSNEIQPPAKPIRRGRTGPRKAYNVRFPTEVAKRIRRQADIAGVTETEVVAALAMEGLAVRENEPSLRQELHGLAEILAMLLDRVEAIEGVSVEAARAAVKGAAASRQMLLGGLEKKDREAHENIVNSRLREMGILEPETEA